MRGKGEGRNGDGVIGIAIDYNTHCLSPERTFLPTGTYRALLFVLHYLSREKPGPRSGTADSGQQWLSLAMAGGGRERGGWTLTLTVLVYLYVEYSFPTITSINESTKVLTGWLDFTLEVEHRHTS